MKKVSIVIPVYNQPELIIRCLDSIPKRDDIEIICVDDCSTDNTLSVLLNYPGLIIIHSDVNQGSGAARNKGIDIASGEYVLFLDSDDYVDGNIFNDIVDNCLTSDLVYYNLRTNSGNIWKSIINEKVDLCGTVKFIKRSFLSNIRYPEVRIAEDYWFNNVLLSRQPSIVNTEKVMLNYNYPRKGSNEDNRLNHNYSKEVYDSTNDIIEDYRKRYNV